MSDDAGALVSEVGQPVLFGPWDVYQTIRDVIETSTELHADDSFLSARRSGDPMQHREFRVEPRRGRREGRTKARPGDVIQLRESVLVHLTHELDPQQHNTSAREALRDFTAVMRVMLGDSDLSGPAQPTLVDWTREIAGTHLEQTLGFEIQFTVQLTTG